MTAEAESREEWLTSIAPDSDTGDVALCACARRSDPPHPPTDDDVVALSAEQAMRERQNIAESMAEAA